MTYRWIRRTVIKISKLWEMFLGVVLPSNIWDIPLVGSKEPES